MRLLSVLALGILLGGTLPSMAQPTMPSQPSAAMPDNSLFAYPQSNMPTTYGNTLALDNSVPAEQMGSRFWLKADYAVGFIRRMGVPSLIRVAPDSVANMPQLPANVQAATIFPQDGRRIDFDAFTGLRVQTGFYFDSNRDWGLDASGLVLEQRSDAAFVSSTGLPAIARSYFEPNSQTDTTLFFALPMQFAGNLGVRAEVKPIYSIDSNIRYHGNSVFADRTDYLFGFRYFELRESLEINGNVTFPSGTRLQVNDRFSTNNQFYGAQIGFNSLLYSVRRFTLDGTIKVALGNMEQRVQIGGDNTFFRATGEMDRETGGLYARPTNIGSFSRDRTAVIPEFNVGLRYHLTDRVQLSLSYNYLYISSVVRPGSVIDTAVADANIRYIANPTDGPTTRPLFGFRAGDFWIQTVNVGLHVDF